MVKDFMANNNVGEKKAKGQENDEFSETINVFDGFSDSNSESSEDKDEFLDKTHSRFYNRYKNKTELDPWIMSETPEHPQIEKTDNYLSHDCVIKISKFLEEKSIILDVVYKSFPFLSYINSNAWHQDVFKYTNSEAKCPICKESLPETEGRIPNKTHLYQLEASLHQYAIEHGMDSEKFSRKEDPRKYHKFLTDRERLVGEELLHCSIVKSGLSTTWLDELMKEWEGVYTQFIQMFSPNEIGIEITTKA
ncbi:1752_t:CDS:2 [Diversispora eburnea]|uniref:1752_t:CDS:1 n=1 Tax=Diversispora eburnea TaxID=1213867 RepID=A0A9N9BND0_9GLOM|nr:1752_t:CDS:2 [Diversispora eburnea]